MSNIEKTYPLTDIQAGIFFEASCSNYATPVYVAQMVFSIEDKIEILKFLKAFAIVLERHEALRSSINFSQELQFLVQTVYSRIDIPYAFYDYTEIQENKKSENFNLFLQADINDPFYLERPPLMRLAFFKFHTAQYRIVWTRHHILMDGTSVKVVLNELLTVYKALLVDKPWFLPKPLSYEKICDFQKQLDMSNAKKFWQKYLKDITNVASLPAILKNKKTPKIIQSKFSELDERAYRKLREFIDTNKLTVNTLLEGAWGIVLSRYSGKRKVMFGSVRTYEREVIKDGVGLFINTLPIYLNISLNGKTRRYLKNIRQKNKILKKYINTPLGKIKEWFHLVPERFLYQSVLDYKPYSINTLVKGFFDNTHCSVNLHLNVPYPLTLEVIKEENYLKFALHYDVSLFEENYVNGILVYFKQTLEALVEQADNPISSIPAATEQDFKLINTWNNTYSNYPNQKTIHQLFEEQVEKTPSATALVYKDETLSYAELNKRANQLAHYLIQNGVEIETFVAVCLKPHINMVIAVLAVIKSGGAYIPIDSSYPKQRIKYLLEDSRPKIIVTDSNAINLINQIIKILNNNCLVINIDSFNFNDSFITNLNVHVQSKHLMYAVYTSGSTGKPKGVMVEHKSALNTVLSCIGQLGVLNNSRILQVSSFSFDVSIAEWCMAFLSGASLYLIDKEIFSPDSIIEALKNFKISTIILSSSILSALPKVSLPHLKAIAPGGEPCDESTVRFWSENHLFLNTYGITEATICSTMSKYESFQKNMSIIGKPLSNTQVYVLDKSQIVTPVGVPGEIYIGGDGVARGYLNNPELTAKKFIYKSLQVNGKTTSVRLYRTGDIGRWLPSGDLEFLGRLDEQIKIRGFRVDLIEIEHVLENHSSVNKAVVVVNSVMGEKKLFAYVLFKNEKTDIEELKKFSQLELPSYMMPSRFFKIKQFPLTSNGKIDKEKLLLIQYDEPISSVLECDKELSRFKKKIISIIEAILHTHNVPLNKNFFDIGFDSISLVHFSVKLSEGLNVKVNILDLFLHPTVQSLSEHIENFIHNNKINNIKNVSREKISTTALFRKKRVEFADER